MSEYSDWSTGIREGFMWGFSILRPLYWMANWAVFDLWVTSPSVKDCNIQHFRADMKHFICVCVCVCVLLCACPRGVLCRWGSAERLLGEDPPVKWSSSPRWVSNSPNPTGQRAGLCLAVAPHKPGFPLLLSPLALFQLPSAYLTPPPPKPSLSPPLLSCSACLSRKAARS